MRFPAGMYYIGDPCYVIEEWDEFLENGKLLDNDTESVYGEWKGRPFFTASTAYGDGTYYDNDHHEYGVDAGLLSIIPFEVCDRPDHMSRIEELGRIVEFPTDFYVTYPKRGVFVFGNIMIDTREHEYNDEY